MGSLEAYPDPDPEKPIPMLRVWVFSGQGPGTLGSGEYRGRVEPGQPGQTVCVGRNAWSCTGRGRTGKEKLETVATGGSVWVLPPSCRK